MQRILRYQRKSLRPRELIVIVIALASIILFVTLDIQLNRQDASNDSKIPGGAAEDSYERPYEVKNMSKKIPSAIIIGARKCGTRALLKFLQLNPAVQAARREVHFFDKIQNYKLGLEWYRNQMLPTSNSGGDLGIEKSPAYFVTEGVAERIKDMNSSIKLILIFRDPVTRLISDFSQLVANRISNSASNGTKKQQVEEHEDIYLAEAGDYGGKVNYMGEAVATAKDLWKEAERSFEDYVRREDGGIDAQRRAVRIGMYSNYLEKWVSIFPREQIHIVDGENLITNPYTELRQLELFLGLKPAIQPSDFIFNKSKGFYCVRSSSCGDHTTAKTNNSMSCLSSSKGRKHVRVKEDLMGELRNFYAPYNEYLFALTGRTFNWTV